MARAAHAARRSRRVFAPLATVALLSLLALISLSELSGLETSTRRQATFVELGAATGLKQVLPSSQLLLDFTAMVLAVVATVAATTESSTGSKQTSLGSMWDHVKLPVYTALWYFYNVQYNIQNKMLLKVFPATWAVSWFQLATGIPIAMLMWRTGVVQKPWVSKADLAKLTPVGVAFAAGQVATVASLGAVAVSFTHVVKALEPAVNAIGSAVILGQVFHPMVYASLGPVFIGVALASSSELSFTMFGFLTAMASNFAFVARNVLATKFGKVGDMGTQATTRKTNQLAVLTIVAALVLLPFAVILPGGLLSVPFAWSSALRAGKSSAEIGMLLFTSGFHFFMYQLSSFWVLSCVPPITHSVLNTLKRVVIIIMSIVVFRNPVTTQSASGTCIAIGGVLLYTLTKAHYDTKKTGQHEELCAEPRKAMTMVIETFKNGLL